MPLPTKDNYQNPITQNQSDFGNLNQGPKTSIPNPCPMMIAPENCEKLNYDVQNNNINTNGVGGNGPIKTGVQGGTTPNNNDEDGEGEKNEEDDCDTPLVCPQGQIFDLESCNCKNTCPSTSGYLHVDALGEIVLQGLNTVINTDNFRDKLGAIIANTNCDTGKIFKNEQVNILRATPETRTFIKADGSTSTANYYPIEYKTCDGNLSDNEDYDPNKPCSDCDYGDPIRDPQIQEQLTDCGVNGGMFGYTREVTGNCESQYHGGVDISTDYGDPIYAMFDGIATLHEQSSKAGFFVKLKSNIGEDEIQTYYFHLQDGQRVSGSVKAGDIIGYQGTSGNLQAGIDEGSTESHVHIKMRKNGSIIDPFLYFKTEFNLDTGEIISSGCN